MSNSLQNKTVRPGNFVGYNYYYSKTEDAAPSEPPKKLGRTRRLSIVLVALLMVFALLMIKVNNTSASNLSPPKLHPAVAGVAKPAKSDKVVAVAKPVNPCAGNTLTQEVLVSISARHLWACNGTNMLYNSPVITGYSGFASTITPTGTYQIYAKRINQTLTGSDQLSSWTDYVNYWMPFLNNQYGTYGLHDATWRSSDLFGNVPDNNINASHGCVELPLATAQWLYNWVNIGTTVQINT
ncbi:MAG TPA: L,D-transpeptidase [Candidatus Sulfotelmatobacter sp.]|nr:L,D-transpeptidase [Candidatus Sulfotelmatobacter sp.]